MSDTGRGSPTSPAQPSAVEALAVEMRSLIAATGLTLQPLARRLGVSDSALSRYQTGRSLPSDDTLVALCSRAGAREESRLGLLALLQRARDEAGRTRAWAEPAARPAGTGDPVDGPRPGAAVAPAAGPAPGRPEPPGRPAPSDRPAPPDPLAGLDPPGPRDRRRSGHPPRSATGRRAAMLGTAAVVACLLALVAVLVGAPDSPARPDLSSSGRPAPSASPVGVKAGVPVHAPSATPAPADATPCTRYEVAARDLLLRDEYAGPRDELVQGDRVTVEDRTRTSGLWLVRTADGRRGWVAHRYLRPTC